MNDARPQDSPHHPRNRRVTVEIAARTDLGKRRETNEDAYLVFRTGRFLERIESSISEAELGSRYDEGGYVMAVADGMGGAAAGEVASREALVEAFRLILRSPKWMLSLDDPTTRESEIQTFFERSKIYVAGMHAALLRHGRSDPSKAGMGTTLTVAYNVGFDLFVVHVGDSRAYLYREGTLRHISHALAGATSSDSACASLVGLALDRGAPDNVTVIVARYSGGSSG